MTRLKTVRVITLILFLSFMFDKVTAQISILHAINIKAGEKGVLSLNTVDTESKIARISIVVREYPEYTLELNDNGENGDVKAKDGIWSVEINVPYDAPNQKFNLDGSVYDSNGNPIMTKSETGEETKLTFTVILYVFY